MPRFSSPWIELRVSGASQVPALDGAQVAFAAANAAAAVRAFAAAAVSVVDVAVPLAAYARRLLSIAPAFDDPCPVFAAVSAVLDPV